MYKLIWNYINHLNLARKNKHRLFLTINTIFYGLVGYLLWLFVGHRIFANRLEWLLSFIGYPAIILGFILGVFALFKLDQ